MRHWILFAYVVAVGLETGAGLFTSVVVFPVWTASPEVVITWRPSMPYYMQEGDFFMFSSSTTMILALAVLILYARRRAGRPRPWALGSAVTFLVVAAVTAAYFLPEQDRVHGDVGAGLPRAELAAMLERFVELNWIRQALLVAAFLAAVHALGLSYREKASS
jgi:Domain of unknown function (DUF1772)